MAFGNSTAGLAGIIIMGVIMLFVGLFLVDTVSNVIPKADIYDTSTLSATARVNITNESGAFPKNMSFTLGSFPDTSDGRLATATYWIQNMTLVPASAKVLFNGKVVQTKTFGGETPSAEQLATLSGAGYIYGVVDVQVTVPGSINKLQFNITDGGPGNYTVWNATLTYRDMSKPSALTGTIYNSNVNLVGTAFSVMGLILIVAGLAAAIAALRGVTEG